MLEAASQRSGIVTHQSRVISRRWIINAREDLIWFIGSVVSSYALLILYTQGTIPLVPMIAVWAILIDAPHVFGTFSRTYFDRTERRNRGRLLWGSLLFFFAALWAYYHLVKQHYGFMVLYKKKNNDLAPIDNALDRLLLIFAFNYPFVAFIAQDPEAMARVPKGLQSSVDILAMFLLTGTLVIATAWIIRQVQRAVVTLPLNIPKYLLLAAAIPMHWVVLLTPMPHKPLAIVAILTIYHNLQYHRLIWFHNQKYTARPGVKRYCSDAETNNLRHEYGAAAVINRRLIFYIAFGIIFGLIYQGPRQYLGYLALRNGSAPGASTELSFATQL